MVQDLPRMPTSFIGRETEIAALSDLCAQPECRLVTVVGPGGIGKSRLAVEVARRATDQFADGVAFVSLQASAGPEEALLAIASAVRLQIGGGRPPVEQLVEHLAESEMLLVLDNMEHVLELGPQLSEILLGAPSMRLLVTSREVLNLQEEWLYQLQGMSVPGRSEKEEAESFGAVQLFNERARQVNSAFRLQPELDGVVRVCHLVEGMPLAVELAATWTKYLSAAEIADEIQGSIDFLATKLRNVPDEHRQIRAVFDQSWQRLDEAERQTFARLSVFAGGFTREAAGAVAGASLAVIASLVDQSLVRQRESSRYDVHGLLRQFGRQQLAEEEEGATEQVLAAHGAYFMAMVRNLNDDIQGLRQAGATAEIAADLNNIRVAGRWAIDHEQWSDVEGAWGPLHRFYQHQSRYMEGAALFRQAVELLDAGEPTPAREAALARVLVAFAWLSVRIGDVEEADAAMARSVELHDAHDLSVEPGLASDPHTGLGVVAMVQGDFERAVEHGQAARERAVANGDGYNKALAFYVLENAAAARGDYDEAWGYAEQSYASTLETNDRWFRAYARNELGTLARARGKFELAREHFEASYALREEFGDSEGMAVALVHLADTAALRGDHREAAQSYRRGLSLYRDLGDRGGRATALCGMGRSACALGDLEQGRDYLLRALDIADAMQFVPLLFDVLLGVGELMIAGKDVEAGVEILAFVSQHPNAQHATRQQVDGLIEQVSGQLSKSALSGTRRRASGHQLENVLAAVRSALEQAQSQGEVVGASRVGAAASATKNDLLSEREVAVLQLIANGRTNRQVAEALDIRVGTAKWYTSQIYSKLSVKNRTEAVARARTLGVLV
jgi:predicted ATPase/DNA-binding NarL/FixJ family response regulator